MAKPLEHKPQWAKAKEVRWLDIVSLLLLPLCSVVAQGALRLESFDAQPPSWEGVNHRNAHFPVRTVGQNFGYSASTRHAGGQRGELGGRIQPAGEAAYYGYRLPRALSFDDPLSASGSIRVSPGGGNFLIGFFNTNTLNEWRTPNTLAIRINGRGQIFHAHFEYCTRLWRAGAGVIGHIIPGERITARELPSGQCMEWKLLYDPNGADGRGLITLHLNEQIARCELDEGHREDGAAFTHFGLLPVLKTWDDPGEVWLDDLVVNGTRFDLSADPEWDSRNNRGTYQTKDTRPKFDFGWTATHHAGGQRAGELGGLIFRGDCREAARMACYGDRLDALDLTTPLYAGGKVCMVRGVTDSTASIGFYHATWSMRSNPSQAHSVPMDFLGINIEGPSTEGFFFYPVYRTHGAESKAWNRNEGTPLRIYPDGRVHVWHLKYDPQGAGGHGEIVVGLDNQTCSLTLGAGHKTTGAQLNRFGICTPWIDGNSVTVYFDDLTYTSGAEP